MSRVNIFTVVVASLAGLLFGFDTAVISGVTTALRTVFHLGAAGLGLTVSIALLGTCAGALAAGYVGNRLGGRDTLKLVGLLFSVASIGCAFAPTVFVFGLSRLALGVAVGGSSVLAPVYISEIVPARRRGFMVGLFQFNIVFGILLAYLSNFLVGQLAAGGSEWRWKVGVAAIPSLFFLAMLFLIPQSARWLAARGRTAEAEQSLRKIGSTETLADITAPEEGHGHLSWRLHKKLIIFAMLIAFFNQFTGINAILYYLNDIFAAAGFGKVSGDLQAVAVGLANLVATVVGMTFIDRLGRKKLLGTGHGSGYLLVLLILFILAFAFSQGAVIWVYLSEIFPTSVRATGQSVGSATHWIINFIITLLFPIIAVHSRALPFVVFAAVTLAQVFIIGRFFPETKGETLEQLAGSLARHGELA
jgi:sugar porter (SP) family MFS transporter